MQMVCGILAPTKGEVKVDGVNNIKMGEDFRDLLGYLLKNLVTCLVLQQRILCFILHL